MTTTIMMSAWYVALLLMSTMVENESNALFSVFLVFAFGFVVLTLPVGLLLGLLAKKVAVKKEAAPKKTAAKKTPAKKTAKKATKKTATKKAATKKVAKKSVAKAAAGDDAPF